MTYSGVKHPIGEDLISETLQSDCSGICKAIGQVTSDLRSRNVSYHKNGINEVGVSMAVAWRS